MDELISKSQKKREADALQKTGVELIGLSLDKLDLLPLTDALRHAIIDAKSINSHGAMKRQAQLIGKLMRSADHVAILEAYAELLAEGSTQTAKFHEVEQWRERLMHDGKTALTAFIEAYPLVDTQHLRQLIKKSQPPLSPEQHTAASRALFRYLRTYICSRPS